MVKKKVIIVILGSWILLSLIVGFIYNENTDIKDIISKNLGGIISFVEGDKVYGSNWESIELEDNNYKINVGVSNVPTSEGYRPFNDIYGMERDGRFLKLKGEDFNITLDWGIITNSGNMLNSQWILENYPNVASHMNVGIGRSALVWDFSVNTSTIPTVVKQNVDGFYFRLEGTEGNISWDDVSLTTEQGDGYEYELIHLKNSLLSFEKEIEKGIDIEINKTHIIYTDVRNAVVDGMFTSDPVITYGIEEKYIDTWSYNFKEDLNDYNTYISDEMQMQTNQTSFEISKWGESSIEIIIPQGTNRRYEDLKTKIDVGTNTFEWYMKAQDEFEFEIVINERPTSNNLFFDMNLENVVCHYQDRLDVENNDFENCNATDCWGETIEHRPSRIVGSYACYNSNKKVGNIYQPFLNDSEGNIAMCDLTIDNGFNITCPQNFIDTAPLPFNLDPTFGNTGVGGGAIGSAYQYAAKFNSDEVTHVDRIELYVRTGAAFAGGQSFAIYDDSGGNPNVLLGVSSDNPNITDGLTTNDDEWISGSMDVDISANTDYWLAWRQSDTLNTISFLQDAGAVINTTRIFNNFPAAFTNPFGSGTDQAYLVSIFASQACDGVGNCLLDGSYIRADGRIIDIVGTDQYWGDLMRWDISNIISELGSCNNIINAKIEYYMTASDKSTLSDSVRISYATNQTWDEFATAGEVDGFTLENETTESSVGAFSTGTYQNLSITQQLKHACVSEHDYMTLRLEHPDYILSTIDSVDFQDQGRIGALVFLDANWYEVGDKEQDTEINRPKIYVNYSMGVSDNPPGWTVDSNSTNSTEVGSSVLHTVTFTDDINLSSYIFSFDNGAGTFTNDTLVIISGTSNLTSTTKLINSTIGAIIRWQVWANDSTDQWVNTSIFEYNTTKTVSILLGEYELREDVEISDIFGASNHAANLIKWDVSEICDRNYSNIKIANIQFYIEESNGADNDTNVFYYPNQNWTESTTASILNQTSRDNATNTEELTGTVVDTFTNLSIITMVQEACNRKDDFMTLWVEDDDSNVLDIENVLNNTVNRFSVYGTINSYLNFSSEESSTASRRPRIVLEVEVEELYAIMDRSKTNHSITLNPGESLYTNWFASTEITPNGCFLEMGGTNYSATINNHICNYTFTSIPGGNNTFRGWIDDGTTNHSTRDYWVYTPDESTVPTTLPITPTNETYNETVGFTNFTCEVTSNNDITNVTLIIDKYFDGWYVSKSSFGSYYNTTINYIGGEYDFSFNTSFSVNLTHGFYKWSCSAEDILGNISVTNPQSKFMTGKGEVYIVHDIHVEPRLLTTGSGQYTEDDGLVIDFTNFNSGCGIDAANLGTNRNLYKDSHGNPYTMTWQMRMDNIICNSNKGCNGVADHWFNNDTTGFAANVTYWNDWYGVHYHNADWFNWADWEANACTVDRCQPGDYWNQMLTMNGTSYNSTTTDIESLERLWSIFTLETDLYPDNHAPGWAWSNTDNEKELSELVPFDYGHNYEFANPPQTTPPTGSNFNWSNFGWYDGNWTMYRTNSTDYKSIGEGDLIIIPTALGGFNDDYSVSGGVNQRHILNYSFYLASMGADVIAAHVSHSYDSLYGCDSTPNMVLDTQFLHYQLESDFGECDNTQDGQNITDKCMDELYPLVNFTYTNKLDATQKVFEMTDTTPPGLGVLKTDDWIIINSTEELWNDKPKIAYKGTDNKYYMVDYDMIELNDTLEWAVNLSRINETILELRVAGIDTSYNTNLSSLSVTTVNIDSPTESNPISVTYPQNITIGFTLLCVGVCPSSGVNFENATIGYVDAPNSTAPEFVTGTWFVNVSIPDLIGDQDLVLRVSYGNFNLTDSETNAVSFNCWDYNSGNKFLHIPIGCLFKQTINILFGG